MASVTAFSRVMILVCAGMLALPGLGLAQLIGDDHVGNTPMRDPTKGRFKDSGGDNKPAVVLPRLTPKPAPLQRLDPGAWLCRTEGDLQQHAAAVQARLDGRDATEPAGCRFVRATTPVTIVERHGQAVTEVRLPGQPEQLGWTDAVVRDAQANAQ